jgi:hypothetical protein
MGTRLALTVLKTSALTAVLAIVVGGLGTASPGGSQSRTGDDAYQRVVQRAAADHRCSVEEPGSDAKAASALIRTAGGDLRVVTFETGWDVYNGRHPGSLLAVCLADRETATRQMLRVERHLSS